MEAPRRIEFLARGLWIDRSNVLVCRDLKHHHCYLPGGHVEPGETAADTVVREFLEETGEKVKVGAACLVVEQLFEQRGKPRHELCVVFHVERDGGGNAPVSSLEPDLAFEWVQAAAFVEAGFVPPATIPMIQDQVLAASFGRDASQRVARGPMVHFLSAR